MVPTLTCGLVLVKTPLAMGWNSSQAVSRSPPARHGQRARRPGRWYIEKDTGDCEKFKGLGRFLVIVNPAIRAPPPSPLYSGGEGRVGPPARRHCPFTQAATSSITATATCPATKYSSGFDFPLPSMNRWFRLG